MNLIRSFFRRMIPLSMALTVAAVSPVVLAADAQPSALDTIQKTGVLRVGWAPWYPYAYRDPKTNGIGGVTVDLVNALASRLHAKVQWVEDGWSTMIAGLQADKFDMLMPMAITPPRAQAATFSSPFMDLSLGEMVRRADVDKYKSWHDLDKDGVSISVAMGSNTALYAHQVFKHASIVEMKGEPEAVTALITGKVTAWASTYSAFQDSAPGREQLVVVGGPPFAANPLAFVVRKGDARMETAINDFLTGYKTSGDLPKLVAKWDLQKN
jgi:ABC-type amino acid transport substrate-binding protein